MSENSMIDPNATPPAPIPPADAPLMPPPPPPGMTRERPTGVTIIAILAFIQGFIGMCVGCALLAGSGFVTLIPTGVTQIVGILGIIFGLFLAAGPLLQLLFAYGAWNLRSWAWLLGVVATGIAVVAVVLSIIGSGGATIWTAVTNGLLSIIIFVYLLLPDTRKSFNR
jgi:hypothetical protein